MRQVRYYSIRYIVLLEAPQGLLPHARQSFAPEDKLSRRRADIPVCRETSYERQTDKNVCPPASGGEKCGRGRQSATGVASYVNSRALAGHRRGPAGRVAAQGSASGAEGPPGPRSRASNCCQ